MPEVGYEEVNVIALPDRKIPTDNYEHLINNYFKTIKEMEAEFIASGKAEETGLSVSIYKSNAETKPINMDGALNIPSPGEFPYHGYMEENY